MRDADLARIAHVLEERLDRTVELDSALYPFIAQLQRTAGFESQSQRDISWQWSFIGPTN